jgi:hypothetical protein
MKPLTIERENALNKFVNREVLYNISRLVYELGRSFDNNYCEVLAPVLSQDDWESPARDAGYMQNKQGKWFKHLPDIASFALYDTAQEACESENIEPYTNGAYEHWLVTGWLATKLEAKGEMVLKDFYGLTIWGRSCTGQAICLDSVIQEIYDATQRETEDN